MIETLCLILYMTIISLIINLVFGLFKTKRYMVIVEDKVKFCNNLESAIDFINGNEEYQLYIKEERGYKRIYINE